jgi:hypothetical protein
MHTFEPGDVVRHRPSGDRAVVVFVDTRRVLLRVVHPAGGPTLSWLHEDVDLLYRRKRSGWTPRAVREPEMDEVG